jgi:tRNA dimethylallyltransferase
MNSSKPKVLVIVGATASGKTSLSLTLAKEFSGEVISADSRQVYKEFDIGTGKITANEMKGIPHHVIDMIPPMEVYTASDFQYDASLAIDDITSREKLPIIAGGTFFYVDTLLGRITTPEVPPNPKLRAKLEIMNTQELFNELRERDPKRAQTIDPNNGRRLVRALEIVAALGKVPTIPTEEHYDVLTIGIKREKEELRKRFRKRAQQWLEIGFMKEIETLLANGVTRDRLKEIGFEYTLALELYDGDINEETFLQKFVEKNWQYAKKQIGWLKKDESIVWMESDELEQVKCEVRGFLEG